MSGNRPPGGRFPDIRKNHVTGLTPRVELFGRCITSRDASGSISYRMRVVRGLCEVAPLLMLMLSLSFTPFFSLFLSFTLSSLFSSLSLPLSRSPSLSHSLTPCFSLPSPSFHTPRGGRASLTGRPPQPPRGSRNWSRAYSMASGIAACDAPWSRRRGFPTRAPSPERLAGRPEVGRRRRPTAPECRRRSWPSAPELARLHA